MRPTLDVADIVRAHGDGFLLDGDLTIKRDHFTIYVPLATCLVISAVATLVLWVISRLMRK